MIFSSLNEALEGSAASDGVLKTLALIVVPYFDFEGIEQRGQLVVHTDLAEEVAEIFTELHDMKFPIERIVPAAAYEWDDDASMAANNTSAFNYRLIVGQNRLSNHSLGRAIDINPMQNPYHAIDGKVYPIGARYEPDTRGTLIAGSMVVQAFTKRGWVWLGKRRENTDYQHFEKP